jgi:hypothetical protein
MVLMQDVLELSANQVSQKLLTQVLRVFNSLKKYDSSFFFFNLKHPSSKLDNVLSFFKSRNIIFSGERSLGILNSHGTFSPLKRNNASFWSSFY